MTINYEESLAYEFLFDVADQADDARRSVASAGGLVLVDDIADATDRIDVTDLNTVNERRIVS